MAASDALRRLPSVSSILESPATRTLLASHPRAVVIGAVRRILDSLRAEASAKGACATREEWAATVLARLPREVEAGEALSLRRVINASGVVVHTNLGRAPLAEEALAAVLDVARGYSNLEFDLPEGRRSTRSVHVEDRIRELTGAQEACVVNNNAAAVLLCLAGLARGREVIVSRGELVEIGGSFRIPDILAESGARMVEVGTTNRTRLSDYERAAGEATALLLKVHRSNFRIEGFTEETLTPELAGLGRKLGVPVLEDLGSGAFFPFAGHGIPGTPTVREALAAGADLVTVSGDKLLGGPQAGIIAGRAELVAPLRKHPLARAMRVDKLCLSALAATLRLHADERTAAARVPVLRMMLEDPDRVRRRARRLLQRVQAFFRRAGAPAGDPLSLSVLPDVSSPGGGAMPGVEIPTFCVAVSGPGARIGAIEERLRAGDPPVVARIGGGSLLLDLRTVRDDEVPELAEALCAACRLAPPVP